MNEQKRCAQLLQTRKSGFSIWDAIRKNWRGYTLHIALLAAMIVLTTLVAGVFQVAAAVGGGMLFGALLRDLGWLRRLRQNWPLSERITDWDQVERIANPRSTPKQTSPS